MPFDENHTASGLMVNGYNIADPKDREILQHKLPQLNEIEMECQSDEKLAEDDVCFTLVNDFLSRPKLYSTCIVALIETAGPILERRIEAIACFSVKPCWLNERYINTAFGFLTRTRPSFRRNGAIKMFYSMLPKTFATFNVENCVGYIHKENTASLNMNSHTPIFGEHKIYVTRSDPELLKTSNDVPLEFEVLNSVEANKLYCQQHQQNDFAWKHYFDILEHPNHIGTYVINDPIGTVGLSLWDMSKLAKLAVNHSKVNDSFRYHLVHNVFFLPTEKFDNTDVAAARQFQLMEKLVQNVQLFCRRKFGITHLMFDIDETLQEWGDLLDTNFQVVGRTAEYLSGFGINAAERAKKHDIKRWLDPRDFSTLLFFKEGNTKLFSETVEVVKDAVPVKNSVLSKIVSPIVDQAPVFKLTAKL